MNSSVTKRFGLYAFFEVQRVMHFNSFRTLEPVADLRGQRRALPFASPGVTSLTESTRNQEAAASYSRKCSLRENKRFEAYMIERQFRHYSF
jgi:hypothetical protein